MGYKIIYGKTTQKRGNWRIFRIQLAVAIFMLINAVCVRLFWPEGAEILRRYLVSDELSNGTQAVIVLVEQLISGESLQDTVAVFCQELIHGR